MTQDQQRDALRREEEGREAQRRVDAVIEERRRRGFRLTEIDGEIIEVPAAVDES